MWVIWPRRQLTFKFRSVGQARPRFTHLARRRHSSRASRVTPRHLTRLEPSLRWAQATWVRCWNPIIKLPGIPDIPRTGMIITITYTYYHVLTKLHYIKFLTTWFGYGANGGLLHETSWNLWDHLSWGSPKLSTPISIHRHLWDLQLLLLLHHCRDPAEIHL